MSVVKSINETMTSTLNTITLDQMRAIYRIMVERYGLSTSGMQLHQMSTYLGRNLTNWMEIGKTEASKFILEHLKGGEQSGR